MSVILKVFLTLSSTVSLFAKNDGWHLIGMFNYLDIVRNVHTVNHGIVLSTADGSSLHQCLKSSLDAVGINVRSLYYDRDHKLCYLNHDVDKRSFNNAQVRSLWYCEITKSYRKLANDTDRHIIVSDSNYSSCQAVFDDGFRHQGVYKIGDLARNSPGSFLPCNGGWTVFQRRQDGSVDFYRGWEDYVKGFGNQMGEFWLGLDKIRELTSHGNCELYLTLKAEDNHPRQSNGYALYSQFRVEGPATNYTLRVSGFSGNVGDSLSSHSDFPFSTYDRDNDNYAGNCAELFKGGWWYTACHSSNLNGLYLHGSHASYADGIEWNSPWGQFYSLIAVEMKFRC